MLRSPDRLLRALAHGGRLYQCSRIDPLHYATVGVSIQKTLCLQIVSFPTRLERCTTSRIIQSISGTGWRSRLRLSLLLLSCMIRKPVTMLAVCPIMYINSICFKLILVVAGCPHVSFVNPLAPKDAVPRESMETRSIVITKE